MINEIVRRGSKSVSKIDTLKKDSVYSFSFNIDGKSTINIKLQNGSINKNLIHPIRSVKGTYKYELSPKIDGDLILEISGSEWSIINEIDIQELPKNTWR